MQSQHVVVAGVWPPDVGGAHRDRHFRRAFPAIEKPGLEHLVSPAADIAQLQVHGPGQPELPAQAVLVAVGFDQIVRDVEERRPGSRGHVGKGRSANDVHQLRPQHHEAHDIGGIDAVLAVSDGVNLAVGEAVSAAQGAHAVAKSIGEAETRREVVAVAAVGQGLKLVHLLRRGNEFVAQAKA